jgi:hypothetical protein
MQLIGIFAPITYAQITTINHSSIAIVPSVKRFHLSFYYIVYLMLILCRARPNIWIIYKQNKKNIYIFFIFCLFCICLFGLCVYLFDLWLVSSVTCVSVLSSLHFRFSLTFIYWTQSWDFRLHASLCS